METEEIAQTFVFNQTLARLIARGDFSIFIHQESFKSYTITLKTVSGVLNGSS
jgi:hypothetical protein